jgi:signal transduction histidine kinase
VIFPRSPQGAAGNVTGERDATPCGRGDNDVVTRPESRRDRWADTARQAMRSPRTLVVVGSSLAVLALPEAVTPTSTSGLDAQTSLAVALLALGSTLPLALLGTASAAFLACAAVVLSLAGFHIATVASSAAVLIALYRLGRGRQHKGLLQLSAIALAVPFLVLAFTGPSPSSSERGALTVLLAILAPAAALGGIAMNARREAQENRAAIRVISDTLVESTARGERARIARELHDVVAHHISMVVVQAEGARLAVPGLPAAGAQRLSAIGDTARAALVEMRQLLGVLRESAQVDAADRHPQPGLDQVTALIDEAREASGAATRLILRGAPVPLDPSVELVAYRIVQEALTNARRHAPGAAVDVELTFADAELQLRVRDNGPGPDPSGPLGGHGVEGMRERAAAVGGTARAGAARGVGYLVEAILPAKVETSP